MYHVILNENYVKSKKAKRKFDDVLRVFEQAGKPYTVHRTANKESVRSVTAEITSGAGNCVVAVGGDGTLHDVLNGFKNFKDNFLGLIPFGTGNDFAATAGIPLDVKKAAEIIIADKSRPIDFIQLGNGLRSINAIGMGLDVDVLKRAYAGKNKGKSKYFQALIVSLAKFKSCGFTVRYNGVEEKHYGLITAVGNGRQIGGGIKLFPEAKPDDGMLNLLICEYVSKIGIIGAFLKLMTGRVNKVKQVTAVQTDKLTFIPHDENYTIQADGELYENIPLDIRVSDEKLNFFMN